MDLIQNGFVEFFDVLVPSLEVEQPEPSSPPLPAFRGVNEDHTSRTFLIALKERPDIWKNILSQRQNRKDNPGWEFIRGRCGLSDVDATRKYYDTIKKDIVRRVDTAIKKEIITEEKLKVDGLRKLYESQNNYKYWDDAEFLVKHVIRQRINVDLDNIVRISDIKTETEDQHQEDPDALTEQSRTIEVVEENLEGPGNVVSVSPETFNILRTIKQEQEPIQATQSQADPSNPENPEESSDNVEDASTLIDIKYEHSYIHTEVGDDENNETQVRLIMSGIECSETISNDSGNLPTSMEVAVANVDMDDENMDVEESREEMERKRAEAKETAHTFFRERICTLPTEKMRLGRAMQFGIYGHIMNNLAGAGREDFDHALQTVKL